MSGFKGKTVELNSFRLCVPELDVGMFCVKLFERFTICRDLGCFVACWGVDEFANKVSFVNLAKKSFTIDLEYIADKVGEISLSEVSGYGGLKNNMTLPCSPMDDSVVFEDLYMYIHHTNFGFCLMKHRESKAPLTRIDMLEERMDAVYNAMALESSPRRKPDALEDSAAKRMKTTVPQ